LCSGFSPAFIYIVKIGIFYNNNFPIDFINKICYIIYMEHYYF